ncbi:MAG: HSP90 family protein [Cellulomonas sp.]|nr:HSP90 family protein [Cellulomonas sp.]
MSDQLQAFTVDLRGVVDLFARHLYSGPRVYLRELLQNAVDAVTARRLVDPGAPDQVRLTPLPDGGLELTDTGIGLTQAEARDVLATIGRSSKRDLELGLGRAEFLGQFGIGLLSAFMVADRIELVSRSAADPSARAIRWRGYDDGRYELAETDEPVPIGTTVRLRARRDAEHWLAPATVVALAEEFGSLLPYDVACRVEVPGHGHAWRRTSRSTLPWDAPAEGALEEYCRRTLGFEPLASIPLSVPLAGVSGVAYVLPAAPPPGPGTHRVFVKRMLLGTRVDGVLPDWAFFVRCVIDADGLRPTASREALYDDDVLLAVRDALAGQVRAWVLSTLGRGGPVSRRFLEVHHLALRALARQDDEVLDLVVDVLPFETTDGLRTLAQVHAEHQMLLHTSTVEEFRRVAPVARAQGLAVLNAGYVYDEELLARLAVRRPGWDVRPLEAADVSSVLDDLDPDRALRFEPVRVDAARVLAAQDCAVLLRTFEPPSLPALLLSDRDGQHELARRTLEEASDDVWARTLADIAAPSGLPRSLVLNCSNEAVLALLAAPPGPVRDAGLEALYTCAVLLAGESLRAQESLLLTQALARLLVAGTGDGGDA